MQHTHRSATVAAAAALLSLTAFSRPAPAGDLEFAAEIDSCLAAVNDRVVLQDANRVRHLVTESKRTAVGYALTIETSVFSGPNEKHYAVHCLARGSSAPLKLRIEDLDT